MTHSASSFADNTGRALGHSTRLRNAVNGLFFYLAPTIIFFLVVAIGLWRLPGDFWGMYGNDDGMWAAWNLRGIFEWSRPFDLAPFNPLSGMGSTFFPNTPWLNPAALALALPLPREVCYLISYFVYFVELSLSLVLLFRVIGLPPLEAIICAQLYLLVLFPPTNGTFVTLQWYSILPVKAHLVAICNVLLVLILIIGRYRFWTNVICGIGIVFLLICGIFSSPITFLTYAPAYAVAGVALVFGSKPDAKQIGWKLAAIMVSGVLLWLAGVKDYLQGTGLISARAALYPPAFAAGTELLTWDYWRGAWTKFDACAHPFFLCPRFPSFYIFVGSFLGAAVHLFHPSPLRPLAIGTLLFSAFIYVFDFASRISLFGSAHAIGPEFLIWSVYPFVALFLGLLIMRILQFVGEPIFAWRRSLALRALLQSVVSTIIVTAMTLVIPAVAFADWQLRTRYFQPPPAPHNPHIALLGPSGIRHAKIGAITRYLIDKASITPGSPFRGYTASYFVDPQGRLSQQWKKTRNTQLSKLESYIAARRFFDLHYQNRLQETDLWEHNIPTLEEYGQWVTKSAYVALEMLFNPSGKSNSGALRFNATVFLHLYELDLDLLPSLGVRYLITDVHLNDPRAALRATQSASDDAPPIFLYEIADPNLGDWSPTKMVLANSFGEAMVLVRGRNFDLSQTAIVFDHIEGPLTAAYNVRFHFVRGGFHVAADAAGPAAIVLPVQFSTCWREIKSADAAPGVALHRVNGFQTLLTFDRHVDATFELAFSLFADVSCRSRDVAELKSLGVK